MVIKYVIYNKNISETPLEALERFRAEKIEEAKSCTSVGTCDESKSEMSYWQNVPMTYAGRLDPMAEGVLIILVGDECKNKEKYLGLDKEYEVEILFGAETDSGDLLGIPKLDQNKISNFQFPIFNIQDFLNNYIGEFEQEYPVYSSKTVNGRQLHDLARNGELPQEIPTKKVKIYSIDSLGASKISKKELLEYITKNVSNVKGDFRQKEIISKWEQLLSEKNNVTGKNNDFFLQKILVKCSSGTYMRSLAQNIGKDLGISSCAFSIKRTKIIGV